MHISKNYLLLLGGPRVRLAPLYDLASILPYDEFDVHKFSLAMKIGGEYKLNPIGLHQWPKSARDMRVEADELIELLVSMAKQLPDEVSAARARIDDLGGRPTLEIRRKDYCASLVL